MSTDDDILSSLFEYPDDIEGPAPEKAARRIYRLFVKPLEERLALTEIRVDEALDYARTFAQAVRDNAPDVRAMADTMDEFLDAIPEKEEP